MYCRTCSSGVDAAWAGVARLEARPSAAAVAAVAAAAVVALVAKTCSCNLANASIPVPEQHHRSSCA